MGMGRPWLFRASVAGNLLLLTYVALYSSSSEYPNTRGSSSFQEMNPISSSVSLNSKNSRLMINNEIDPGRPQQLQQQQEGTGVAANPNNNINAGVLVDGSGSNKNSEDNNNSKINLIGEEEINIKNSRGAGGGGGSDGVVWDGDDSGLGEGIAPDLSPQEVNGVNPLINGNKDLLLSVDNDSRIIDPKDAKLFPCDDLTPRTFYGQRGSYWVLYNYVRAAKTFRCDQSITYTTHADYTFLDNLVPLLERWQGPLSLSVYAPGTDFNETLTRILYLRECFSPLVKDFVTFHLFFDNRHVPKPKIPVDPMSIQINCSAMPFPSFGDNIVTYKKAKKLAYPVNVARNVARETATTHYTLPSDIELYPNPNLIPDFLEMIKNNDTNLQRPNPKVFVLSIFEVEANVTSLPQDKRDLLRMLKTKAAIPFHKYVCADCHRIPKANEWMTSPFQSGLKVFHVGKRHKPFHHWEPIYIGTKFDPTYDERLSWEGRSDKMTQGYVLCVLDYEFHILDNAFLVHRPGIKRNRVIPKKNPVVAKQNTMIAKVILPELKLIYGNRPGCFV